MLLVKLTDQYATVLEIVYIWTFLPLIFGLQTMESSSPELEARVLIPSKTGCRNTKINRLEDGQARSGQPVMNFFGQEIINTCLELLCEYVEHCKVLQVY